MKFDWIEPGILAASGIPMGDADIQGLHEQGIRAILTLTEKPLTIQKNITPELLAKLDMTTLHVPVVDFQPPKNGQVYQVAEFIEHMQAQGRPVFLHCYAGMGRTGTLLHAYYLVNGLSLDAAKTKVKARRAQSQFDLLSETQQAFLERFAKDVCR